MTLLVLSFNLHVSYAHTFTMWNESHSVMSNSLGLCDPIRARILEWVAFPFSRDLPNPGIKLRSPALQADSLPAEPQGKPKNTGVGSLSLLQWIFLTQESNQGLLHCRQILYQLSYQGSPIFTICLPLLVRFFFFHNFLIFSYALSFLFKEVPWIVFLSSD